LLQEKEEESHGRVKPLTPTHLADKLLPPQGWDTYLEDIGSYWLIHWELATNTHRALIWHLLFGHYYDPEFSKAQFISYCERQLESANFSTTSQMVEREVDCCLKTYVATGKTASKKPTIISEDSLACPLVELELLQFNSEDNLYSFNIGPKPTLPVPVFGYTLYQFLAPLLSNRRTFAVDDCLYLPGSPGQLFKLDENSLVIYLEELEKLTDGQLRLQESLGLRQLYFDNQPSTTAGYDLLDKYYA
jgi:hypothetical protein